MNSKPLPTGATIGILGGGQLGRMLSLAAAKLGLKCHIYAPDVESVAAEVSAFHTRAAWDDEAALKAFAASCDVVTYEFENVPVGPLAAIDPAKLAPNTKTLEIAQNRLSEKQFVADLGGSPAPFAGAFDAEELAAAAEKIGTPAIIKTCRDGYDGKGQWRVSSPSDLPEIAFPDSGLVYEGFVKFEAEFSVILVRSRSGEIRFWDSAENRHDDGILARSSLPASPLITSQMNEARDLASKVADRLDYVGVLTLEFFATQDGPIFNEMAPRVHNSGHWTMEGAVTCQFENHIRAIAGLPLGDTSCTAAQITMVNLIGEVALDISGHLSDPAAHFHLYGKAEARAGRKMGHVTWVGSNGASQK